MTDDRCTFIKPRGEQCRVNFGLSEDGLCWHHSPANAEKRRKAHRRGGKNAAQAKSKQRFLLDSEAPPAPETIEDLKTWSFFLVWAIATGRIDPRTADSVTRAIKVAMDASEGSELRERLTELEAMIAQVKRSGITAS